MFQVAKKTAVVIEVSFKASIRVNKPNTYIFFDGFTYSTRGYFSSCGVFLRGPKGRGKIQAMSKMSARIICKTIFHYEKILLFWFLFSGKSV